jgi:hypothetical protein
MPRPPFPIRRSWSSYDRRALPVARSPAPTSPVRHLRNQEGEGHSSALADEGKVRAGLLPSLLDIIYIIGVLGRGTDGLQH